MGTPALVLYGVFAAVAFGQLRPVGPWIQALVNNTVSGATGSIVLP